MRHFLLRDLGQLRRSWYIFFFQLPWLPEAGMRAQDWREGVRALRASGQTHTFSDEDIEKYKQAWSQPGAMRAMINWYRAVARYSSGWTKEQRVSIPTLMLWGKNDVALTHRMAQPSIDLCDDGRLVFFEQATHWVQHDEAEAVNKYLVEFVSGRASVR
jgi:pimeloyl-ACP methyl ester carboxylesterase